MDEVLSRRQLLAGAGACLLCGAAGGFVGGRLSAARASTPLLPGPTATTKQRLHAQPDGVFRVQTDERVVALSFDDGPDPAYTPHVLDVLDRYEARATFFLVGVNAGAHQGLVADILGRGHDVGNHTYDHPDLETLDPPAVAAEIDLGARAIEDAGAPRPKLFRPPKGFTDEAVGVIADTAKYRTVFWDLCVEHFVDHQPVDAGVDVMLHRVRPGSIVLAHDGGRIDAPGHAVINRERTMEALPKLLEGLHRKRLEIVDVSKLLVRTKT
jgi:chitooligosaccharide deacetylase